MPGVRTHSRGEADLSVGERGISDRNTRERVLEYMRAHPVPWRAGTLARKLRTPAESLRQALTQLRQEGSLVSCTVTSPNQPPQEEYRIAAHTVSANLYKFVINKNSITGRPVPKVEIRATPGANATR